MRRHDLQGVEPVVVIWPGSLGCQMIEAPKSSASKYVSNRPPDSEVVAGMRILSRLTV